MSPKSSESKGHPDSARRCRGWSLVELMVALLVLAILLSLAYPAYNNQVIKSRRADGHALLYEAAQRQQQFFTSNNQYTATVGVGGLEMAAASDSGFYTLSINRPNATTYTLTATAVSPQDADTDCGNLSLTSLNIKACSADGCEPARCW